MKYLRITLSLLLAISLFLTSCGSEDEGDDPTVTNEAPFFKMTLSGTDYEADFTQTDTPIFAALVSPTTSLTSITMTATTGGGTIGLGMSYVGSGTDSYTLTSAPGEGDNLLEGFAFFLIPNGAAESADYEAVNINLNITSYNALASTFAVVEGTFSGIVEDSDGVQTEVSGSFRTSSQ